MPPAAAGTARPRQAPAVAKSRPRRRARANGVSRIHWNRLGRVAMLGVAAALLYLYLSAGLSLYSTLREAHRNSAQVRVLERQNEQLLAQHASLSQPSTLMGEARQLGMERPGEQPYVIEGLPKN
jgi:hypothetical protein